MSIISEEDKKVIKDAIVEISFSMTRIENERLQIKDIVDSVSEKFLIPKSVIKRAAKVYHKDSISDELLDYDEFITLYGDVIDSSVNTEE